MKQDKILVTGAAGFIGSSICRALLDRGSRVMGIDNLNSYYDVRLKKGRLENLGIDTALIGKGKDLTSASFPSFSFMKADITSRQEMESLFEGFRPDVVINMAAQAGVRYSIENPYEYISSNISGFLVLLECARHYPVKKFLYASSSSVYGSNTTVPFSEEDRLDNPVSLYAVTKISDELMARTYRRLYGVPAIGLRFFTVYGPWGRPDMAPMLFADAITRGGTIKVFNGGNLSRDFTYIDDITEGVLKVVEHEGLPSHEVYNIGHGSPVELMDFISLMERAFGREARKEYYPMQKGDVMTTFADTSRLEEEFGYSARVPVEEGIGKFVEWYRSDDNPLREEQ